MDIPLNSGLTLRVQPVTANAFRIRLSRDGSFPEPGLVRYGIVQGEGEVACETADEGDVICFATGAASLAVNRADGTVHLFDKQGKPLVAQVPASADRGFDLRLTLQPDEQLYGHGDETRDRLDKRGHKGLISGGIERVFGRAPRVVVQQNRRHQQRKDPGHGRDARGKTVGGRLSPLSFRERSGG